MAITYSYPISERVSANDQALKPPLLADYFLVATTFALLGFGLVMVYSTTGVMAQERFSDSLYFAKRQIGAAIVGIIGLFILSRISIDRLRRISPWCYVLTLVLLLLPVVPGLGDSAGGAKRWVHVLGVRFQPGEFAKLAYVLFMAGFLARHEHKLATFKHGIVVPLLLVGPIALLFLLKPDFGSAVVVTTVALAMAAAAGVRLLHLGLCGAGLAVAAAGLVVTSPYRMARVISFLSPWSDPKGSGYQLIQSLIAVGSGEVSGVGLGAGQQKLFYLPAPHTDFIFAVICEELGFIGAVLVICLFMLFFWRGMLLASRMAEDTFSFALCTGLTLLVVLPALLNMGVALGLLPTKGMVLPFVAYGGSSLLASLFTVGLLLGLGRHFRRTVR